MNKLEVGMYCRYKRGSINGYVPSRIGKIIERLNDSEFLKLDTNCTILENDIIGEPSFNPIDLIGVGDYVNGMEVMNISDFKDGSRYIEFDEGRYLCKNYQIKSIVTKEQFSSMEYRLGDK